MGARNISKLLFLLFWFLPGMAAAQSTVKIEGRITEIETGRPLPDANVVLAGTGFGAVTDDNGVYRFHDIPQGEYRVRVTHIGYRAETSGWVTVTADFVQTVDFSVAPAMYVSSGLSVSGEREPPRFAGPTADIEIIGEVEIRNEPYASVGELLQNMGGVFVETGGGPGSPMTVSIRGGKTDKVKVLLDGVDIAKPHGGAADLSRIPLSIVERITVIRGSSGVTGSGESPGGVIYIETKKASPEYPGALATHMGSFGAKGAAGTWSGRVRDFSYMGNYERSGARRDFTYLGPNGESSRRRNADYSVERLFAKLGYSGRRAVVSISGFYHDTKQGLPGFIYNLSDDARSHDRQGILNLGVNGKISERLSIESRHAYNAYRDQDRQESFPAYHIKNTSFALDNALRLDWKWNARFSQSAVVQNRLNQGELGFVSTSGEPGLRINRVSSFVFSNEYSLPVPTFIKSATSILAFGYTMHHGHEGYFTPKSGIAAEFQFPFSPVARINWSRALHLPDFYDLYFEGYRTLGNPDLKAERGTDFDAGGEIILPVPGVLRVKGAYFWNTRTDMIHWRQRFDGVFYPFNLARAEMRGSEWGFEWGGLSDRVRLHANYTHMKALNKSGDRTTHDKLLTNRPVHMLNAGGTVRLGGLSLTLKDRYSSERFIREANSKWLPAYRMTDVILGSDFRVFEKRLTARLGVYNAFNQNYAIVERAPMPGRELRFSTEFMF